MTAYVCPRWRNYVPIASDVTVTGYQSTGIEIDLRKQLLQGAKYREINLRNLLLPTEEDSEIPLATIVSDDINECYALTVYKLIPDDIINFFAQGDANPIKFDTSDHIVEGNTIKKILSSSLDVDGNTVYVTQDFNITPYINNGAVLEAYTNFDYVPVIGEPLVVFYTLLLKPNSTLYNFFGQSCNPIILPYKDYTLKGHTIIDSNVLTEKGFQGAYYCKFAVVKEPKFGKLRPGTYGTGWKYYPKKDYIGQDSFVFKLNNGTQDSNCATVTINVLEYITGTITVHKSRTEPYWRLTGSHHIPQSFGTNGTFELITYTWIQKKYYRVIDSNIGVRDIVSGAGYGEPFIYSGEEIVYFSVTNSGLEGKPFLLSCPTYTMWSKAVWPDPNLAGYLPNTVAPFVQPPGPFPYRLKIDLYDKPIYTPIYEAVSIFADFWETIDLGAGSQPRFITVNRGPRFAGFQQKYVGRIFSHWDQQYSIEVDVVADKGEDWYKNGLVQLVDLETDSNTTIYRIVINSPSQNFGVEQQGTKLLLDASYYSGILYLAKTIPSDKGFFTTEYYITIDQIIRSFDVSMYGKDTIYGIGGRWGTLGTTTLAHMLDDYCEYSTGVLHTVNRTIKIVDDSYFDTHFIPYDGYSTGYIANGNNIEGFKTKTLSMYAISTQLDYSMLKGSTSVNGSAAVFSLADGYYCGSAWTNFIRGINFETETTFVNSDSLKSITYTATSSSSSQKGYIIGGHDSKKIQKYISAIAFASKTVQQISSSTSQAICGNAHTTTSRVKAYIRFDDGNIDILKYDNDTRTVATQTLGSQPGCGCVNSAVAGYYAGSNNGTDYSNNGIWHSQQIVLIAFATETLRVISTLSARQTNMSCVNNAFKGFLFGGRDPYWYAHKPPDYGWYDGTEPVLQSINYANHTSVMENYGYEYALPGNLGVNTNQYADVTYS